MNKSKLFNKIKYLSRFIAYPTNFQNRLLFFTIIIILLTFTAISISSYNYYFISMRSMAYRYSSNELAQKVLQLQNNNAVLIENKNDSLKYKITDSLPENITTKPPNKNAKRAFSIIRHSGIKNEIYFINEDKYTTLFIKIKPHKYLHAYLPRFFGVNYTRAFIYTLIISLLFISLSIYQFFRVQFKPLKELTRKSYAFANGSKISNIKVSGPKEIRNAIEAFNSMKNKIQDNVKAQKIMLSGISHDLKTPLTRIKLLLEDNENTEINKQIDIMLDIIENYLEFGKQQYVDKMEKIDLSKTIKDVARTYKNQLKIEQNIEEHVYLLASKVDILRIVSNILDNSIEYASQVYIELHAKKETITLTIEDNGSGIPNWQKQKFLEAFQTSDKGRKKHLGLGLAIVNSLVKKYSGKIFLKSGKKLGGLKVEIILTNVS